MDFTWAYVLVPFISAGGGAYLGSYLKKKGENLATKEDIDDVVEQMKLVTKATKEIEAKISNEVWDRQRQWELKREAVYMVMQAVGMTDAAVTDLSNALKTQKKSKQPGIFDEILTDRWTKAYEALEDLERKRSLSMIVCGGDLTDTLFAIKSAYRDICHELADDKLNSYQMHSDGLTKRMSEAFVYARQELGLERVARPQSTGSSATPSPAAQGPATK
jgi:hypothetical protein